MEQQASITVLQFFNYDTAATLYKVKQTTNTTIHEIGAVVTKAQVDGLILSNIKVVIKGSD